MADSNSDLDAFLHAATVPRDTWHASGNTVRANQLLAGLGDAGTIGIFVSAVLGDADRLRAFIDADPSAATRKGGPHGWDPLTYLCFSNYLKEAQQTPRALEFTRAATLLLDAGADAKTGWWEPNHEPKPEWEPALYGAAGVAHDPDLTALLIARGANPTDDEVVYHTPETHDNRAMRVLVGSGKLRPTDLAMLLIRKLDWHDIDGLGWLLEQGAPLNVLWRSWGMLPLHHGITRDCSTSMIALLVEHGGDPRLADNDGVSAYALAARYGRADLLTLFDEHHLSVELDGLDALLAACARGDHHAAQETAAREPSVAESLREHGGDPLVRASTSGNAAGVATLMDIGVPVDAPFETGSPYHGIPRESLAIHAAAWRGRHDVVRVLIDRGSPVTLPDPNGQTPLMLAVRACVGSYWTVRRAPDSVAALLRAGAQPVGITLPTGYDAIDALLSPLSA